MRKTILLAALALAWPAFAQAPEQKPELVKPMPKAAKVAKKPSAKRLQDARHCLSRTSNDAIIRCAEEYL